MCSNEENRPARGFWTPPATWNSTARDCTAATMSERKRTSPAEKTDLFHIVHKVPAGDSPYVRAKHVQLIDKDPSRAISFFWAAINAGDRIDSALKDMTVVMKQLNRSDEAIEAIKSFRHLCHYDSQDSLDNLLLELYKKSGRVDEEAELLEHKLKSLKEGTAFGGRNTKTKRCQGKQIAVTIEQEKARLLGNLAWVHLQQHNYGIAEQHYRKALSLELDKNKQCNLAICLMRMNKVAEAKSLLQNVGDSLGNQCRADESYSKSFERAVKLLTEIESRHGTDLRSNNSMGSFCEYDTEEGPMHLPLGSNFVSDNWIQSLDCERFHGKSGFWRGMKENQVPVFVTKPGSVYGRECYSPWSVRRNSGGLFTQPRKCKPGFEDRGPRSLVRRLLFEKSPVGESLDKYSAPSSNGKEQVVSMNANPEEETKLDQKLIHGLHEFITRDTKPDQDRLMDKSKKSWADIVEEEENEEQREGLKPETNCEVF